MTEKTADAATAVLTLRSPADLLAAIPYLVGFHPCESIVVVALAGPRMRVTFTMRSDLPESNDPAEVAERAAYLADVLAVQHPSHAMLAGYGAGIRVTPMIDALRTGLDRHGIPLREALRVQDDRYWSYLCDEADCCPAEGIAYDPCASGIAAHAVFAGCVALPDRHALVAEVAPVGGGARRAMRRATLRAEKRLAGLVTRELAASTAGEPARPLIEAGSAAIGAAIDRALTGELPDDEATAWLAALLTHLRVRDEAWVLIDARDDHAYRRALLALWTHTLRRAEPGYVAGPACLLAYAAWRDGDGGLANVALDRARAADPEYSMAGLLEKLLGTGTPPSAWRGLREDDLRTDDERETRKRARRRARAVRAGASGREAGR